MDSLEDGALIERTLAGETGYFDVLFGRHESAVRNRIRSIARNTAYEDDLVQQVFLKAWCHLASFRSESSIRTWILRIAVNEAIQLYRRECHSPVCTTSVNLDVFASNFETPQECFERNEAAKTVRSVIAELPETYKQCLILHYLKELGESETARRLHGSVPMVKSRLFRARRTLVAALRKCGQRVSMPKPANGAHSPIRTAA